MYEIQKVEVTSGTREHIVPKVEPVESIEPRYTNLEDAKDALYGLSSTYLDQEITYSTAMSFGISFKYDVDSAQRFFNMTHVRVNTTFFIVEV
ncbi:hypothetical protein PBI_GRAYSON_271 [Rhodococcus phage Grayson]|nr:hypothetical protein PBI_GRAYSON_271 [Rhodococcus phage Grayson]